MKPFRVICINASEIPGSHSVTNCPLKEGADYTVIAQGYGHDKNGFIKTFYDLAEFKILPEYGFDAYRFVRLPGLTADEMEEESKEAIVGIENPIN